MNYKLARAKLNRGRDKTRRKIGNNTYLLDKENYLAVKYHKTEIIKFYENGEISISTGGWNTKTTRQRLNEYLPSEYHIYSEKFVLYLVTPNGDYEFFDGIIVKDGIILNPRNWSNKQEIALISKLIKRYCKDINLMPKLDSLENIKGDCFHCNGLFPTDDTDHLIQHLEERYLMGSLIMNALTYSGYPNPALIWHTEKGEEHYNKRRLITMAVRKYFNDKLIVRKGELNERQAENQTA